MPEDRAAAAIVRRASLAGVSVPPPLAAALSAYVALLARWNRTINLTALDVSPPSDEGIDRLIVEPLVAAELLGATDGSVIDIGSGGGSPAIPLKIARPDLRFVLVEINVRKSGFLREAIRQLSLANVDVETARVEDLAARGTMKGRFDVATLRAVRGGGDLFLAVRELLAPAGRVLWFGGAAEIARSASGLSLLPAASGTGLRKPILVLQRSDP